MLGIDLFAGAGGMSVGALAAGIRVTHAVEANRDAAETFRNNHHSTLLIESDVRKVTSGHFKSLDRKRQIAIFGGPPCQGFSTSNRRNRDVFNEKNWLFREYVRLVRSIRPDWVVFENVKGLLETESGFFLEEVLKGFRSSGYTTSHFVLNSACFGVPQRRNRLFIVASLHGLSCPAPKPNRNNCPTVGQALSDLPTLQNGNLEDVRPYARTARNAFAKEMRGDLASCYNNVVTRNAPHIVERYTHIPPGGNWMNIPSRLMRNYADASRCHTGIYRRLHKDEPAIVIGNFRKNMLIHPSEDRGLSVREAARLQSFPDRFRFYGSIGFQQQQVGNAVPPKLAQAVFSQILMLT
jgi:DNA (cytosine-5)-methyltransferase 1